MEKIQPDDNPVYERPTLAVLGSLHDITKLGGAPNADLPRGPNNTAYPPASF